MMHEAIIDETLAVYIERSAPSQRDVFSPDCVFFSIVFFPFFQNPICEAYHRKLHLLGKIVSLLDKIISCIDYQLCCDGVSPPHFLKTKKEETQRLIRKAGSR